MLKIQTVAAATAAGVSENHFLYLIFISVACKSDLLLLY